MRRVGTEPLDVRASKIRRRLFAEMQPSSVTSQQFQRWRSDYEKLLRDAGLQNAARERPRYSKQLKILAQNAWFISVWNTPLAWLHPLATLFKTGQKEKANRRLRVHFNQQADEIEAELAKAYPRRRVILQKAFRAHRRRDYELCIPVFLAQADGIAREITEIDRFSIYSRDPAKLKSLKQFVDAIIIHELQREVLELALIAMPLNVSTGDSTLIRGALSRHEILHGIDTDYASATNSCRSISWLQYMAHFAQAKDFAGRKAHQSK